MNSKIKKLSWVDLIKPIMLIAFAAFIVIRIPIFLAPSNLISVLSQGVVIGLASIGMSMVIFSGEIDISLGGVIYVSGVVAVQVYLHTGSMILAIVCSVATGALCGLLNGIGVAVFNMPSMITTLAIGNITTGAGSLLMGKSDALVVPEEYRLMSQTKILGITSNIWLYLLIFAVFFVVIHRSRFGRYIYAIGDNRDALNAAGINVKAKMITIFVLTGILCSIAALLNTSRLGSSSMLLSVGTETYCIAAVVVGGASMSGGKGNLLGTFAGAYVVAAVDNLLRLMKVNAYIYDLVWGLIIFVVVLIDILKTMQAQRVALRQRPEHAQSPG